MKQSLFQVNLSGILKVLSDNLYSHREVFLRELLQNAVDAIHARKLVEDFVPNIKIEYYSNSEGSGIIFNDNGIGLTEHEVEEFLSKIGASSKSAEELAIHRNEFIGQFGIGLLSCFMVTNEITVITKSVKSNLTIRWVGNIDGSYRTEISKTELKEGTRVVLTLRKETDLTEQKLLQFVAQYGEYVGMPIEMEVNGTTHVIGREFPWDTNAGSEDILSLGKDVFNETFLDFIALEDADKQTKGIAYIIPTATHYGTVQNSRVYIKKMFISGKASSLLPEWAFFVRAIVNSYNLSPTASREDIYSNKTLEAVSEALGECVKRYFRQLSKNDPRKLESIIGVHSNALKSIALSDDDFLKFIYQWFRFQTTQGDLALKEIKARTHSILYISDMDQFRQVIPMASANKTLIINAAYIYDAALLEAVADVDSENLYNEIDAEYFGNILNDISIEEHDSCEARIGALQHYLDKFECELLIKKFEPVNIPAIFYLSYEKLLERDVDNIREESDSLWSDISSSVFTPKAEARSKLFLNYNNPIVSKLIRNTDARLDQPFAEIIYTQAMMLGHYPLNHEELSSMNTNLIFIMDNIL